MGKEDNMEFNGPNEVNLSYFGVKNNISNVYVQVYSIQCVGTAHHDVKNTYFKFIENWSIVCLSMFQNHLKL